MILAPDPRGISRQYAVTVRDKLYYIDRITFYKDKQILVSPNAGWLETQTSTGTRNISRLEIPAKEIKLKRNSEAYDGTTYIIATGKDWSGHRKANLYIPAADLGIRKTAYELHRNGKYLYTIWKGTQGIYIETFVKSLCKHLDSIRDQYEETYNEVDDTKLSVCNEDAIRESLDKLKTLAEAYFAERKRLANLTVEDLDLPVIEPEE